MRESKFRAWDKINRVMIYPDHIHPEDESLDVFDYPQVVPAWFTETSDRIWLEWIGLKDKNGKEGYHKDLFRKDNTTLVVEWSKEYAGWYLAWADGGLAFPLNKGLIESGEFVGSIYENPELDTAGERP